MSYNRFELLIKRAKEFLKGAYFHLKEKDFDIAVFNLEQSLQLYLKAVILKHTGLYPEVHGVKKLLSYIYVQTKNKELASFTKKFREELEDLEEAYINARYGNVTYSQLKVKELFKVVESCILIVSKITSVTNVVKEVKKKHSPF